MRINGVSSFLRAACLSIGLAGLTGCSDGGSPYDTDVVRVAVPVPPIAGLVRALVSGEDVEVVVLVPDGANPATHAPSMQDQQLASDSRLYLEIGHPEFVFERAWLDGVLEGSHARRVPIFEGCPVLREDPHVWVSATCLGDAADVAARALGDLLPESSEAIEENLRVFKQRLAGVAASIDSRLAGHEGASFIVLHPAWGYFARDHGLTQVEILSHGTGDPGAARVADLIRTGREQGVRTIFTQPQFNSAPAEIIARELGAETVNLDPLMPDPLRMLEAAGEALSRSFEARVP
jgi:zinc transport system substrate-binding protein